MTRTLLSSDKQEIVIGFDSHFVLLVNGLILPGENCLPPKWLLVTIHG